MNRLSHHLMKMWWDKHRASCEDGDFLFPAFNKGGLNFKRSLSNHEQNQMVKDCATWLEKAEVDHGIIFLHTSNYLMN